MREPYTTICPHCGKEVTIPYQNVQRHITRVMGRISASKRSDRKEHVHNMIHKRWADYRKKQEAKKRQEETS